jgi:hypothetical protein
MIVSVVLAAAGAASASARRIAVGMIGLRMGATIGEGAERRQR